MRTFAELQRRKAAAVLESSRKVGQAVEATLFADGFNRKIKSPQQAFSIVNSNLDQVIAETHAHFGTEQVREITG